MQSELPNFDEEISFVVDHGTSVGPMALRDIIDSVRDGERDPSSLIWWSGATDWIRFDSDSELVGLALPPVEESTPDEPAPMVFEPSALTPALGTAEPEVFEPQVAEPTAEPEPVAEPLADVSPLADVAPAPLFNPATDVGTAQFGSSFAADPTDDGWSSLPSEDQPAPVTETAPAEMSPVVEAPEAQPVAMAAESQSEDDDAFSFNLPKRSTSESSGEDKSDRPAITGLFSSGPAPESKEDELAAPSPDALDAILAARSSLESVGARIEALSSATKASLTPEQIQSGMGELDHAAPGLPATESPVPTGDGAAGSWTNVESESAVEDAEMTSTTNHTPARLELNERFKEMVAKSTEHQRRIEWVTRVDELLLSACITAIADSGFVAIDLHSSESDHVVLFDHNDDSRRVRLELSPLDTVSARLGRHVTFGLAWGRDVSQADRAFEIVRQNIDDNPADPGTITGEADMATASVSTHVQLILAADDFVKDDYSVDRSLLDSGIAAALHALEERWHELFDSAL